jgi:hypothetical protein
MREVEGPRRLLLADVLQSFQPQTATQIESTTLHFVIPSEAEGSAVSLSDAISYAGNFIRSGGISTVSRSSSSNRRHL